MTTCGEILPRLLERYGVEIIFGIPGVHTVELYRGLPASNIRHITPRHEQGAGFMADGYARVTGRPGVCFIITGPGMTNIMTAMGQAYADSIPMLVISSVNRTEHLGMGQGRLHEMPHQSATAAGVAAFSHTLLHPDQLPEVLARTFAVFASARPRPVHIEIPTDVITRSADDISIEPRTLPSRPAPDPKAVKQAVDCLSTAESPVVVFGGGAIDAGSELLALVEHLGSPWINSVNAKGVLPPGHPLYAGENLSFAPLREAIREADVVLAVGTELGETEMYPIPYPLSANGRVIRIDIDPQQIMCNLAADVAIVSDARMALASINAELGAKHHHGHRPMKREGQQKATGLRRAVREQWWPEVETYERVFEVVAETLPGVIIVGDQTQPIYAGNQFYQPASPRSWFNSSTGFGTLGYALPAAIGARLAAGKRPVVAIIGDGGLQFTLSELASAVEANAPIIVLVWNNRGYGEIKTYMTEKDIATIGVDLYTPDFVAIARGFGLQAEYANSLEKLRTLLSNAFSDETPNLIELKEEDFVL